MIMWKNKITASKRNSGSANQTVAGVLPTVAIVLSLLALVGVGLVFLMSDSKKIGVVRTDDLIAAYKGTHAAQVSLEEQGETWQQNLDTLQADYKQFVEHTNANWHQFNKREQQKRSEEIASRQQNLQAYMQRLGMLADAEEERVMNEMLGSINEYIQAYAEQEGYDVIYGATVEGSILHSKESLDITEDLIALLNARYDEAEQENMATK